MTHRMAGQAGALIVGVAVALTAAGCSKADNDNELTVYAAASLSTVFSQFVKDFEASHTGLKVTLSTGGSQTLINGINQGAVVDIIATADNASLDKISNKISDRHEFATNTLTIITPPGNPKGIHSLADLARSDVKTVLCGPEVPCGAAAQAVLKKAGITVTPVSEETAVTGVVTKIETRQADAGLVYVTDAKAAGTKVTQVTDPATAVEVNHYPIAEVNGAQPSDAAQQFIDFVIGDEGQQALREAGFGAPAA